MKRRAARAAARVARGSRVMAALVVVLATAAARERGARAQTVDVDRPLTLVVGAPTTGARTARVDGARTGHTRTLLPTSHLHAAWRVPLGMVVEQPPLVDASGRIYVVGTRGETVCLGRDGAEQWRVPAATPQAGPASLLVNGSVVFVDAAGQAIALRDGAVRWRVRFARNEDPRATPPAPLPLDDGGVVVAEGRDLAELDGDGHERSRATLPEPCSAPLVAARARGPVVAITTSGAVWTWSPGAQPERVASFDAAVDTGGAMWTRGTLAAVSSSGTSLLSVNLDGGARATLAAAPYDATGAPAGLWLGPPAIRPGVAAAEGPTLYVTLWTPGGETMVAFDTHGAERARFLLRAHSPQGLAGPLDAHAAASLASAHTAPLVDDEGSVAFATVGGAIGVADPSQVDLLGSETCEPPVGSTGSAPRRVAGFAPFEPGAFVVVCRAGAALLVEGSVEGSASERTPGERRAH